MNFRKYWRRFFQIWKPLARADIVGTFVSHNYVQPDDNGVKLSRVLPKQLGVPEAGEFLGPGIITLMGR
jgi:hypothetical protein